MEGRISKVGGGWRKSTHSGEGSSTCVEVAAARPGRGGPGCPDPSGPRLAFGAQNWDQFLARVRTVSG